MVGPTGNQSLESPHLVHNGAFLTGELVYGGEHALWRYQGDGTLQTRVYLRDAMGSVIGLMDENGQLIETFDYDAFGNVRSPGGEALPEVSFGGDSRFQGMWKDAGTGLYYVRARYYDARTGRFLSRDPAEGDREEPETFLPYAFANNDPYAFRDPGGAAFVGRAELNSTLNVAVVIGAIAITVQTYGLRSDLRTGLPLLFATNAVSLDATLLLVDPAVHVAAFLISLDVWLSKAKDAGKNDPHGDARALEKAAQKIEKLKDKIKELESKKPRTKRDTREIAKAGQKIKNLVRDAAKKAKGETHHRR